MATKRARRMRRRQTLGELVVLAKEHHGECIKKLRGAVFSARGGDFLISVGGDLSVGYRWHDLDALHLFCVESVSGRLLTADAVCLLAST